MAYTDDILLFLSDPITTIPNLLKDFALFNSIYNLQIHFAKSKALNISLPLILVLQCQANFPFGWEPHALTYLGIQIPTKLSELYKRYYLPIVKTIQQDFHKWNSGHFSWFVQLAIIKMNVLPRILYLFQTVPIKIPLSFFTNYKQLCRNVIWASKSPRLSWDKMTLPKSKGGLGLPDVHRYQWSCHLTRIIDWHIHRPTKDWITIEESFAQVPLSHLPWIDFKSIPKANSTHPLTGPSLLTFKAACNTLELNPSPGPTTPLDQNSDFRPGFSEGNLSHPHSEPPLRAQQFFHNNDLITYATLSSRLLEQNIPFYKFLQIIHFLNSAKPLTQ